MVNILGADQGELAYRFATSGEGKFREVGVREGKLGVPMLSEALAHIECEVVEQVVGGTHTVFMGKVVSAEANAGQPLTYYRGGFGRFEFAQDDAGIMRERATRCCPGSTPPDHALLLEDLAGDLGVDRCGGLLRPHPAGLRRSGAAATPTVAT